MPINDSHLNGEITLDDCAQISGPISEDVLFASHLLSNCNGDSTPDLESGTHFPSHLVPRDTERSDGFLL